MNDQRPNQFKFSRNAAIVIALLIVAVLTVWVVRDSDEEAEAINTPEETMIGPAGGADNIDEALHDDQQVTEALPYESLPPDTLVAKWQRPDGGYILEISAIHDDGTLEASYLNPRPIAIVKAEFFEENVLRVFVEFEDKGYEGSNYNLTYDAGQDVLAGQYFQAPMGQTFDVSFIRMRE